MNKEEPNQASGEELMEKEDRVHFQCRPGLSCFTTCCQDVNIFLSPYDIVRLKNRLGVPSDEFLEAHTRTLLAPGGGIPLIQLKMREPDRRCPFVADEGCSVYEDRPWACRMFPLDWSDEPQGYRFLAGPDRCKGRLEPEALTIQQWLRTQELGPYDDMDLRFQIVTRYPRLAEAGLSDPKIQHMVRMACYDLDTFRRFVFESRFLEVFEVDEKLVAHARTEDVALLELAFQWLRFGLVCGDVLPIKEEVRKEKEKETEKQAE